MTAPSAPKLRPARSTVRLSCQVMAHPSRAFHVEQLLAGLDREVPVTWDRHNDRHDTGTRAMTGYDPNATHHLVVQDDAIPCRDLLAGVERMLAHVPPATPVSLYTGRVRPFARAVDAAAAEHDREPVSFLVMPELNWGVAVVLPVELIGPLFDWYPHGRVPGYDARMGQWFLRQGIDVWYSWPSLVDHRHDVESLVGHGAGRQAHTFVGEDRSALDVDWTARVLRVNTTRTSPAAPSRGGGQPHRRRRQP